MCLSQLLKCSFLPYSTQHAGANHQNLFDNVTVHAAAQQGDGTKAIALYDGSGAGYWQPGHGGYNTTWNLNVLVTGGARPDERVTLQGLDEGPMALIVGVHGNREFELDYRPKPLGQCHQRAHQSHSLAV